MLQRWLALTAQEMTDTLYTLVISRYGAPLPEEQHFRHLLSAAEFKTDEWFAVEPVLSWIRQNGLAGEQPVPGAAGTGSDSGLKQASLAWIRLLAAFGWCQLGSSAEGAECFRWKARKPQLTGHSLGITPQHQEGAEEADSNPETASSSPSIASHSQAILDSAAEAQDTVLSPQRPVAAEAACSPLPQASASPSPGFIVQPDFEVLVPPEVPYTVRWTLAGCAEPAASRGSLELPADP